MDEGLSLDLKIATTFFGWQYIGDGIWYTPKGSLTLPYLPQYSMNIKEAWSVVEILNAMGFGVSVYTQKSFECAVDIYYDTQSTTTYDFGSGDTVAREKTAPLAICKAALRVVGIEV
jgi:hypothetical protein